MSAKVNQVTRSMVAESVVSDYRLCSDDVKRQDTVSVSQSKKVNGAFKGAVDVNAKTSCHSSSSSHDSVSPL